MAFRPVLVAVVATAAVAALGGCGSMSSSFVWGVTWSPQGSQVAVAWEQSSGLGIYRVGIKGGGAVDLTPGFARAYNPSWSPDGRMIAFNVPSNDRAGDGDLELMTADDSSHRRLARDANEPAWSPDGRTIVTWATGDDNHDHLKLLRPDGRLIRELNLPFLALRFPFWSSDGKWIEFYANGGGGPVYAIQPDGHGLHIIRRRYASASVSWSPDGRSVAYVSDVAHDGKTCDSEGCSWNAELYVRRMGRAPRRLTFDRGAEEQPSWSPDGKWIAFVVGGKLMAIHPDGSGLHHLLG
jgi:Tol biopolymer transport system component